MCVQACQEPHSPLTTLGRHITSLKMWPGQRLSSSAGMPLQAERAWPAGVSSTNVILRSSYGALLQVLRNLLKECLIDIQSPSFGCISCSVLPVLDAKQIQHRMHLSLDTIEAPPGAVGQTICETADAVDAQLVIVGHNRQPVGFPSPSRDQPQGFSDNFVEYSMAHTSVRSGSVLSAAPCHGTPRLNRYWSTMRQG